MHSVPHSGDFLMRTVPLLLLLLTTLPVAAQNPPSTPSTNSAQAKPDVVRYHATIDNVKYVYGTAPPVAHLRPGNILEANSLDCFGNAIQKPGDTTAMAKGDNPLTGPFFIEGA